MQLLVIGADTQIVRALSLLCREAGYDFIALPTDSDGFIVSDEFKKALAASKPDFVINASLYPSYLLAEANPQLVDKVNHLMPIDLATICCAASIPMVQISDTFVFDGKKEGLYQEDDEPKPVSAYGKALLAGENAVKITCPQHIILRTGNVFSQWGENDLTRILGLAKKAEPIVVAEGLKGCPTPAADVARVVIAMLQQLQCGSNTWGTFHYCSSDATTAYDFADAVLSVLSQHIGGIDKEVTTVSLDSDISLSLQPTNAVMSCKKILNTYGIKQRAWRSGLTAVIKDVYPELPEVG